MAQVALEEQPSGIHFVHVCLLLKEHKFAILLSNQQNLKNQRTVQSQTRQHPILLNFCFLLPLFLPRVKLHLWLMLSWSGSSAPGTSSEHGFLSKRAGFNTLGFLFVAFRFGSFCVKPIAVLTILSTGHPIKYESFCSWKVVYFFFFF